MQNMAATFLTTTTMACISLLAVLGLCLPLGVLSISSLTKTLVSEGIEKSGAMCIDGSPPGYYMRKGSGNGAKKYLLHMQGGGWCTTLEDCYKRSLTDLGSSKNWPDTTKLGGIFSDDRSVNPDFYNWNAVYLMYCDGGSFAGDSYGNKSYNGTDLYFRGSRILPALLNHLTVNEGLSEATDVILTGCSAGGLAVYLNADKVKKLIPTTVIEYNAFADAGYFIDIPDVNGSTAFPDGFYNLMMLQNMQLDPYCSYEVFGNDTWKCLLAPVVYSYIGTPLFVVNSKFDAVILNKTYHQPCLPPDCSKEGQELLDHYETVFNMQVEPVIQGPPTNGYFLDSCYVHCQTLTDETWTKYAINGRTLAQTFGDWYFERSANVRLKDCEDFPCNPTCSKVPPHDEKLTQTIV